MDNQNKLIKPPDSNHKRYSSKPFPPYRFVPGINPHPTIDPEGHSYGRTDEIETFDPAKWQENETYLFGVDLYNFAYWWESHEAFEGLWGALPKGDPLSHFLQGLIQISAAFLKWHMHEKKGVISLYKSAMDYLGKAYQDSPTHMGVDLQVHMDKLLRHFKKVTSEPSAWPSPIENYPFIILDRNLR